MDDGLLVGHGHMPSLCQERAGRCESSHSTAQHSQSAAIIMRGAKRRDSKICLSRRVESSLGLDWTHSHSSL
jgi:hypothetical protein